MNRDHLLTMLTLSLAVTTPTSPSAAQNFTCEDREMCEAAEQARVRSAIFWMGKPFSHAWSQPCPISAQLANHRGGGVTSFRFSRGEVFGWKMCVAGSREAILSDVIPHEVDHMVRASIVRRPLPRWLDEGCAILMESPAEHARQREIVQRLGSVTINAAFLDAMDYPKRSQQAELYAVGFSLVEYLLALDDAHMLLAFQVDQRPPSRKLHDF